MWIDFPVILVGKVHPSTVLNFSSQNRVGTLPYPGEFQHEFLEELLLNSPIPYGARPALSENSHISDSPGRVLCDENELVCLIHRGHCLHFLSLTPASSSQIVLQTSCDSSALQEAILNDIPLQRVWIRLLLFSFGCLICS